MHATLRNDTPIAARGFEHWPLPLAANCNPPAQPRSAGGLSGRPTCRIYFRRQVWVLELETASGGWLEPWQEKFSLSGPTRPTELTFPTLAAAIGYAERHGFDYRVIGPVGRERLSKTRSRTTRRDQHNQRRVN